MVRKHWFIIGILLVVPLGIILHDAGELLYSKASYFAFTSIFFTGLNLELTNIRLIRKLWLGIILSNLITSLFAPLLIYLISSIFSFKGEIYIGTMILSVLPTTIVSHIVFCEIAGGNTLLSVINTVVSNLISLFTIPFFLNLFLAKEIDALPELLFSKLVLIIFLPIVLSQGVKRLIPSFSHKHSKSFPKISQVIVLLFIFIGVSINYLQLSEIILSTLFISIMVFVALSHGLLLLMAYMSGKVFRLEIKEKISILFSSSQKTLPVGMALFSEFFPFATKGTVGLICYHLFQLFLDSYIAHKISSKTKT